MQFTDQFVATESGPTKIDFRELLREGGKITAILLFWGALALIGFAGIPNIGFYRPRSVFWWIGNMLGWTFVVTGIASILIYTIARAIQLSRQ